MMVRCLIMLIPEGLVKYLRTNLTEFTIKYKYKLLLFRFEYQLWRGRQIRQQRVLQGDVPHRIAVATCVFAQNHLLLLCL